ncbi:rhodanese-related sulfurtransferase [Deinococcus lacus]|uniref:tRNA uridine(34) hydroxylase n=1 Tax=Deinococcus lacus TaxID=392561 RepID=A0ABW1YDC1_9DEIO
MTHTRISPDSVSAAPAWVVAALYEFRALEDPAALQRRLQLLCREQGLCGTLIVAPEGINGTVAGPRQGIDALHRFLLDEGFTQLEYKESGAAEQPFKRMKVRLKREIVTLGVPVEPRSLVGHYLSPQEWNDLLQDPDVVVIDTRNRYEYAAGTFQGALDPGTGSFREFPEWLRQHQAQLEGKKVAMFCTGGIRCEKSTSLLLQEGFEQVYHLKGGILRYLEQMPQEKSLWQGECFVFDERVTVGHGLAQGEAEMCHSCGWPVAPGERADPRYERGSVARTATPRPQKPKRVLSASGSAGTTRRRYDGPGRPHHSQCGPRCWRRRRNRITGTEQSSFGAAPNA